jgi:anti-sigma B factor antagonist
MGADDSGLAIQIESARADAAVVHCRGSLTLTTAGRLRHEIKALLQHTRFVTIDFAELQMIDSVGLGTIAALYVSARTAGGELYLVNLTPRIRELFSVTRLLSLFEGAATVRMP